MNSKNENIIKDKQYYKFCLYGFLKNLRFFEPFFILFFLSKELSFLEIGTLYAVREIAINFFEIPSGIIADALGRRKTLASSFLVYIIAFIIFYSSGSFPLFILAMLFYALGDAIRTGINKAMIIDYLGRTGQQKIKVNYYGHTRSWSQLGSALSSLAGGILYFYNQNLDVIFLFSIVPYLLDFVNVLSYPKYLDENIKKSKSAIENLKLIGSTFIEVIKDKELIKTLLNVSVYSGFYKSVKDFIQPFLKSLILSLPILYFLTNDEKIAISLGIVYFLIFLSNAFVSRHAAKIAGYFKTSNRFLNLSLLAGGLLGLASGLMMEYYISLSVIILFILILSIENARKPSGIALITDKSENIVHAGILSVQSQLASVFGAIFVMLIGLFSDLYGVGIGISVVSIILLFIIPIIRVR